jgi:hypothetical protein
MAEFGAAEWLNQNHEEVHWRKGIWPPPKRSIVDANGHSHPLRAAAMAHGPWENADMPIG